VDTKFRNLLLVAATLTVNATIVAGILASQSGVVSRISPSWSPALKAETPPKPIPSKTPIEADSPRPKAVKTSPSKPPTIKEPFTANDLELGLNGYAEWAVTLDTTLPSGHHILLETQDGASQQCRIEFIFGSGTKAAAEQDSIASSWDSPGVTLLEDRHKGVRFVAQVWGRMGSHGCFDDLNNYLFG
jgi:hypothetical protein